MEEAKKTRIKIPKGLTNPKGIDPRKPFEVVALPTDDPYLNLDLEKIVGNYVNIWDLASKINTMVLNGRNALNMRDYKGAICSIEVSSLLKAKDVKNCFGHPERLEPDTKVFISGVPQDARMMYEGKMEINPRDNSSKKTLDQLTGAYESMAALQEQLTFIKTKVKDGRLQDFPDHFRVYISVDFKVPTQPGWTEDKGIVFLVSDERQFWQFPKEDYKHVKDKKRIMYLCANSYELKERAVKAGLNGLIYNSSQTSDGMARYGDLYCSIPAYHCKKQFDIVNERLSLTPQGDYIHGLGYLGRELPVLPIMKGIFRKDFTVMPVAKYIQK
jgi:hypothetical protein